MKFAFGIVAFDGVVTFGCFVVAGLDLCTNRIFAQGNPVGFDNCFAVAQVHLPLRLFDENVVYGGWEHGLKCSFLGTFPASPNASRLRKGEVRFFYLGFPALCERTPLEINRSQMRPHQWRLYEV